MKKVQDTNIEGKDRIPSPLEFREKVRQSENSNETVLAARSAISDIVGGRLDSFLVIVGPCSIHDKDSAIEYARRLRKLSQELSGRVFVVMRTYFEKPRSVSGWKGLMSDPLLDGSNDISLGIGLCREIACTITDMGMPIAIEALDPHFAPFFTDLASYAAIGARTVASQTHRAMASGLSMPVGFKNATSGGEKSAVEAIKFASGKHQFPGIDSLGQLSNIKTLGNPSGHLILRGSDAGPNHDAKSIAGALALLKKYGLRESVIVDCSHGNSGKDHSKQAAVLRDVVTQRARGNSAIRGVMLESHLKEGKQAVPDDFSELSRETVRRLDPQISITDSCIGWEETEALIREVDSKLRF